MSNKQYEPLRWKPGGGMYEARRIDPERCRAIVHGPGRGFHMYQCRAKAKYSTDPGGTLEWCGTHSPAKIRTKREAADAKYRARMDRFNRADKIRDLAAQACDALLEGEVTLARAHAAERAVLIQAQADER